MANEIDPEAIAAANKMRDLLACTITGCTCSGLNHGTAIHIITAAYAPRIAAYESRIKKLTAALESVRGQLVEGPIGPDFEADPDNGSPEDSVAHILGLCIQSIDEALIGDALDNDPSAPGRELQCRAT